MSSNPQDHYRGVAMTSELKRHKHLAWAQLPKFIYPEDLPQPKWMSEGEFLNRRKLLHTADTILTRAEEERLQAAEDEAKPGVQYD